MKPHFFSTLRKPFIIFTMILSAVAFFGVVHTFSIERDLTQNHRNSLTPATRALLKKLNQPLHITLYGADADTEKGAKDLVTRITRIHVPVTLAVKTLADLPEDIKKQYHAAYPLASVATEGTPQWILLKSLYLSEDLLIQALRDKQTEKPFLVFLEGHGERSIFDTNRDGLSEFKKRLDDMGMTSVAFNLSKGAIPENATAIAIASPKNAYQPEDLNKLYAALQRGMRLIWLKDPTDGENFTQLQQDLGIQFQAGTLIDGDGASFESPHPAIIFIRHYPETELFQNLKEMTALPWAQSFKFNETQTSWQKQPLLMTSAGVWHELENKPSHEPEGPQMVAASFERSRTSPEGLPQSQRI